MQVPPVACHKPVGSYKKLHMMLYVFEHKMQYISILAAYTRIVWYLTYQ